MTITPHPATTTTTTTTDAAGERRRPGRRSAKLAALGLAATALVAPGLGGESAGAANPLWGKVTWTAPITAAGPNAVAVPPALAGTATPLLGGNPNRVDYAVILERRRHGVARTAEAELVRGRVVPIHVSVGRVDQPLGADHRGRHLRGAPAVRGQGHRPHGRAGRPRHHADGGPHGHRAGP